MAKRIYSSQRDTEGLSVPEGKKSRIEELISPPVGSEKGGILNRLFLPLIQNNRISQSDLRTLADNFGDFYQLYRDPAKVREFARAEDGKIAPLEPRSPTAKQLGRFTIEALGKRDLPLGGGIVLDGNLGGGRERGLFRGLTKDIALNPSRWDQDILSTIVHEGNHALENYNPYVQKTAQGFIQKKLNQRTERDNSLKLKGELPTDHVSKLSSRYIPSLFKGIQNIIGMKEEFTDLFNADSTQQRSEITQQTLDNPYNGLAGSFNEIPTHALESLMRDNQPWNIDARTNPDPRRLLKSLMKETHQLYSNLGLVDRTQPPLGSESAYRYNKAPVPNYPTPMGDNGKGRYDAINNTMIERIRSLSNPNKVRPTLSTPSPYPSSSSSSSSSSPYPDPYSLTTTSPYQNPPNPYSPATSSTSYTTSSGLSFPNSSSSSSAPSSPFITQGNPNISSAASMQRRSFYTPPGLTSTSMVRSSTPPPPTTSMIPGLQNSNFRDPSSLSVLSTNYIAPSYYQSPATVRPSDSSSSPTYKKGGRISKGNLFRRFKSNKGKLLYSADARG